MDREAFGRLLGFLMKGYPQSKVQLKDIEPTWYALLRNYTTDELKEAIRQALMNCKFFPTLAEVAIMTREAHRQRLIEEDITRRKEEDAMKVREEFFSPEEVKSMVQEIIGTLEAGLEMEKGKRRARLRA